MIDRVSSNGLKADVARWMQEQVPEPMQASGEDVGFAGIPPMPEIGPQMKAEAKRRWARIQEEEPEKAEEMREKGFGRIEEVFEHFEHLFGDFFPSRKSDYHEPEAPVEPNSEPPQES